MSSVSRDDAGTPESPEIRRARHEGLLVGLCSGAVIAASVLSLAWSHAAAEARVDHARETTVLVGEVARYQDRVRQLGTLLPPSPVPVSQTVPRSAAATSPAPPWP